MSLHYRLCFKECHIWGVINSRISPREHRFRCSMLYWSSPHGWADLRIVAHDAVVSVNCCSVTQLEHIQGSPLTSPCGTFIYTSATNYELGNGMQMKIDWTQDPFPPPRSGTLGHFGVSPFNQDKRLIDFSGNTVVCRSGVVLLFVDFGGMSRWRRSCGKRKARKSWDGFIFNN